HERIPFLSIRGAIVAGAIGGVLYGVNFGLQVLVGVFAMTGATGFISGFTVPFFLVIASRLNRQWGTATVIWTLYSALAIPTALMGTPGTYKLFVGVLGGLAYDAAYCGLRCKPKALYLALVMYVLFLAIGFYAVYVLGLMPEIAGGSIVKVLAVVSGVFLVEGMISTWLANIFYTRRLEPMGR
ncbi:MAG: hypothetical protein AB1744_15435, partial [Candidatus Zixiibacteriota bacterium]